MSPSVSLPAYRVPVSPLVLRWARETAGLTLEEASRIAQVSVDRLEAWEAGTEAFDPPTIAQLRTLSNIFKRPISLFLLQEPPAERLAATYARRLHGASPEAGTRHLRFAVRDACDQRRIALELFTALGEEPPRTRKADVRGRTPEDAATAIRDSLGIDAESLRQWGKDGTTLQSWIDTLDAFGVLIIQYRYVAVEERRGFAVLEFPLPVVALNEEDARTGRLFTLAHEYAHIQRALSDLDADDEVWCNAVAAAMLLPEEAVRAHLRAFTHEEWQEAGVSLATTYAVSREAAYRRMSSLGFISEAEYGSIRAELLQEPKRTRSGFVRYPGGQVRRLGRQYIRVVGEAYDQGAISLLTASRYLGVQGQYVEPLIVAAQRGGGT